MLTKAQEAYNTFLASQSLPTYNFTGMTQAEKDAEMVKYTELKIAAAQEVSKNAQFVKDRGNAFRALEEEYNTKRTALQTEWQNKEDALV